MAFIVDDYGNITLVQGDSGQLTVSGIPDDKSYTVYLAIQDSKRNPVGSEIHYTTNAGQSSVVFEFTPSLTDLLTVKRNEDSAEYYYGVKVCDAEGFEDTLIIGDSDIGDVNTITVYPKKVEGTVTVTATSST